MTHPDPTAANIAIAEALGLDPATIRKGATLTLDGDLGPILAVEMFLLGDDGRKFTVNNDVATELRRYKLVPLNDDAMPQQSR